MRLILIKSKFQILNKNIKNGEFNINHYKYALYKKVEIRFNSIIIVNTFNGILASLLCITYWTQ